VASGVVVGVELHAVEGGSGLCDSCPAAGGVTRLSLGMPAHRRNPLPPRPSGGLVGCPPVLRSRPLRTSAALGRHGWGPTVTQMGDGIETLRTNNRSSGYAPPIQPPCVCPICPAPEGTDPKLGIPGRCSPLSSRGVRLPGGVSRRPTARARRVIAFQRACAMSLMIRTSRALA